MDLLKNVEALLMVGFGALCAAAWSGQAPVPAASTAPLAQSRPTLVLVITAKRLTAAEKRAFDLEKRS